MKAVQNHIYLNCSVGIDFDEQKKSYGGSLSILSNKGIIEFSWKPDVLRPFDINQCNIEESEICFMLHQVNIIQILEDENYELVVRFGIPSMSTFSRFLFGKEESALFMKVIAEFEKEMYVQKHPKFKNSWKVLFTTKKQFLIPKNVLSLKHVQLLYSHRKIHIKLMEESKRDTNKEFFRSEQMVFDEEGRFVNFDEAKKLLFKNGAYDDSVRRIVWPYLFGVYSPEMTEKEKERVNTFNFKRYCNYRKQCDLMTKQQEEVYKAKYSVIHNDAVRTEKGDRLFQNEEHGVPTFDRILFAFVIFDRDTDYTQGMGDYLAILMMLFIQDYIDKDNVILYDGSKKTITEVESFIFWNFVGLLRLTQGDMLFRDILHNQEFLTERTFEIVSSVHPVLHNWFNTHNFSKLVFIYRSFLLLFKRDFEHDFVMRIWDIIFTSENPKIFPRFFAAAMVLETFPAVSNADDLGTLIENFEKSLPSLVHDTLIDITFYLYNRCKNDASNKYLFMEIHKDDPENFVPKYFKLHHI